MRHFSVTTLTAACCLALSALAPSAQAQDIDLFLSNNAPITANPNVLIVIDNNSSNNSYISNTCNNAGNKKMPTEQCVLMNLINSSAVSANVNIGLALFTPSGATNGGFVDYAVRPMDATGKSGLISAVSGIQTYNNAPYALSMYESYLYYQGLAPYAGTSGSTPYDPAAVANGNYVSPFNSSCQKNYIIFIGNGAPDSSENNTAQAKLSSVGGLLLTDPITLNPSNDQSNWMDEFARFMYKHDLNNNATDGTQSIVTYTVGVYDPSTLNQKPVQAGLALLQSAAQRGGGQYYAATDTSSLVQALQSILVQIQAVNSVFAAVTLPVSVNVRGTYLNQVYMGVFRPDAHALPRWMGNLKEYQLALNASTNSLYLADVNSSVVTNNANGFVNPGVTSFWTNTSTFWSFEPTPFGVGGASDAPDGDLVEKGAEAEWLRNAFASAQSGRHVYTCTGSCPTTSNTLLSGTPFDTTNTNITQANTGATSATELTDLINWTRGQDNVPLDASGNPLRQDENANGIYTDARASIHGDVLHSIPAVVNYNRYGDSNDVMVFYGGNDGMIHAIQGGQIQPGGSPVNRQGGTELWSFVPTEFYGQLKRLRDDNVNILSPNPGKPYFADGPIGVYQNDVNGDTKYFKTDGDQVYLYPAMRRGGRFFYALDVTDPGNPYFLWRRANTDTGYSELGQTWSMPKPVKIRASSDPVLIMGAGYDPNAEDVDPRSLTNPDTMGRGVYVIDAVTGSVLWKAGPADGMIYSMAADMMVLDRDGDGLMDRVYAVDTGANIWRLDIDDANPNKWTITKLAALGSTLGSNDDRKFLFAPDVVYGDGTTQNFDAILIGSGDREHPFNTNIINRFYMIEDPYITNSPVPTGFQTITEPDLYDATSNLIQTGTSTQQALATSTLNSKKGWYITLGTGEKVVSGAVTMGGTVYFGTNQPTAVTPGVCTNLGTARLYGLNFLNGTATTDFDGVAGLSTADRSMNVPGGGFPPTPVPVITIINGTPAQAVISGTQLLKPPTQNLGARAATYWHNDLDR